MIGVKANPMSMYGSPESAEFRRLVKHTIGWLTSRLGSDEGEAVMGWRPIETEPGEGEYLVVDAGGAVWLIGAKTEAQAVGGPKVVRYPKDNGCWCCLEDVCNVVAWMPVPTFHKAGRGEGGGA